MSSRVRLPKRHRSETFDFLVQGQFGRPNHAYTANIGFYPNGRIGDVFLRHKSGKAGTDLDIATRELSIAVSFALQHGATVEEMKEAFPRHGIEPEGALGKLFDLITETGIKDALAQVLE
jgi:hypothetical protein